MGGCAGPPVHLLYRWSNHPVAWLQHPALGPTPPHTGCFTRAPTISRGRALLAGSRQEPGPLGHCLVSGSLPRVTDLRARQQQQNSYYLLHPVSPLARSPVFSFLQLCQGHLYIP